MQFFWGGAKGKYASISSVMSPDALCTRSAVLQLPLLREGNEYDSRPPFAILSGANQLGTPCYDSVRALSEALPET